MMPVSRREAAGGVAAFCPAEECAGASPCAHRRTQTLTTPSRRLRSPPASGSGTAPEPPTPSCSAPADRIPIWPTWFDSREGRRRPGKRETQEAWRRTPTLLLPPEPKLIMYAHTHTHARTRTHTRPLLALSLSESYRF